MNNCFCNNHFCVKPCMCWYQTSKCPIMIVCPVHHGRNTTTKDGYERRYCKASKIISRNIIFLFWSHTAYLNNCGRTSPLTFVLEWASCFPIEEWNLLNWWENPFHMIKDFFSYARVRMLWGKNAARRLFTAEFITQEKIHTQIPWELHKS